MLTARFNKHINRSPWCNKFAKTVITTENFLWGIDRVGGVPL